MTDAAADRKLFLGGRLKRLRRDLTLTQSAMARDLGVSPSYLNHIERNQRPVTAQLLFRLADVYDVDLRALSRSDAPTERDISEALVDPLFQGIAPPRHEVLHLAEDQPALAKAFLRLYQAYTAQNDRLDADLRSPSLSTSVDWVQEWVQQKRNHFADLDAIGETMAAALADEGRDLPMEWRLRTALKTRFDLTVRVMPAAVMVEWTRRFDPHRRRVLISDALAAPSRLFALAYQMALMDQGATLDDLVEQAGPPDAESAALLKVSLTNSLAAAMLMPYAAFQAEAVASRYDLSRLQARFEVSFEQAAHRLTTLSRPAARGVPFFLMRVDRAGNISKRFAADAFPFARFGGGCPRWRIHDAFATPGRVVTQVIETPDGQRWFTLARTVDRQGMAGSQDLAVALGCELKHAGSLIYARGLDLASPETVAVGPACRLCPRHPCAERAAPPLNLALRVDEWSKSVSSYPFASPREPM